MDQGGFVVREAVGALVVSATQGVPYSGKKQSMFDESDDDDDDMDPIEKERRKKKFAKLLLNSWDHTRLDADDLKSAIGQNLLLIQHEDLMLEQQTTRSVKDQIKLYARRTMGMMLSAGLLGVAAYVIIRLTITSSELEQQLSETQFASFSAFLVRRECVLWRAPRTHHFAVAQVPVAVSLLNAFQPPIIIKIAQFEQWDDPGRQVKYTVWRLFVAKLLNVILQVASFSMLADPVLLRGRSFGFSDQVLMREVRASVEKAFVPTTTTVVGYTCRADQVHLAHTTGRTWLRNDPIVFPGWARVVPACGCRIHLQQDPGCRIPVPFHGLSLGQRQDIHSHVRTSYAGPV